MRVLCLIPAMGPGGAERVMSRLVTHLAREHEVSLLTWEPSGASSFYPLPPRVRYIRAGRLGGRGAHRALRVVSRPGDIRQAMREGGSEVVISFTHTMNVTALGSVGASVPVIVSERNDPRHQRIGWVRSTLRDQTYRFARFVVVPTRQVAEHLPAHLRDKIRVIANPVPQATVVARPGEPRADGRLRLLSIGSLTPQKGHARLIDAFASIAAAHREWDLVIVGEGSERPALEEQVRRHRLEQRARLPGLTRDVFAEIEGAQLFAFPSHYEGFPNALAEAVAAGLPAVGYAGVSGVEELIKAHATGLLVDPRAGLPGLSSALSTLMADGELRRTFGDAARRHSAQWAPSRIFQAWDDLLVEARVTSTRSS